MTKEQFLILVAMFTVTFLCSFWPERNKNDVVSPIFARIYGCILVTLYFFTFLYLEGFIIKGNCVLFSFSLEGIIAFLCSSLLVVGTWQWMVVLLAKDYVSPDEEEGKK